MKKIPEYQGVVVKEIEKFQKENKDFSLYDPVKYILDIGGKRLRPVLTLVATDLFGGIVADSIKPALGIEVFHNFTLLHDDIMDNAPLRRGQATVHEKWNVNAAILSGDVMFVQAFSLVTSCKNEFLRDVLDLFNVTAVEVCEGQQHDMDFESRNDVSIDEYIEMIRLKTSVLVACALKLGAILASAPKEDAEKLYDFGLNLGIAFQIKDDILDVFGDAALVGKKVGGDILANKKTYLLLKALEDADESQNITLKSWLSKEGGADKVEAVTEIFKALSVKEKADKVMDGYYQKSLEALDAIQIDATKKKYLYDFARGLMSRTF
jgi:geranylgeranyl diphosphate synthase type II|tara:strand:- start:1945 stop:2913 length:969 start_codon:yes stop_codon:yes gene_type:complete